MPDPKDLVAAVGAHLEYMGHCEDSDEDNSLCDYPTCTYCALALAYDAFVNNRAPDHVRRRGDDDA